MNQTKRSFVQGALVLSVAGIICKIIGAAFRIPLTAILRPEGMAYYQVAYPIYTALLVISSAGIPAAISKMVSERTAIGDYRNAHYIFQTAYRMLLLIGFVTMLLMVLLSWPIAKISGAADAYPSLIAIAPSLFFVSVISAYRGYFQGLQQMTPTALSQIIEQLVKLAVGYGMAMWLVPYGALWGAVGAIIGVSVSELVAMLYLMGTYGFKRKEIAQNIRTSPKVQNFRPKKQVAKQLLSIAIPITIGASIMPLVNLIDNVMVMNILQSIGFSELEAKMRFGLLTGYIAPVINMPTVLSTSLQVALVPAISSLMGLRNVKEVRQTSQQGLKLALLVALPCTVGLFILAGPIITMLYKSTLVNYESILLATTLMRIMSFALFMLILIQTVTGIIQGMGKPAVPVRNLAIGAGVKVVATFILMRYVTKDVTGASIGTFICYSTAALLNIYYLFRHAKIRVNFVDFFIRPILCSAGMGGVVFGSYMLLTSAKMGLSNSIATLASVLFGILVYFILIILLRAIQPEDAKILPGGSKLDYALRRIGFWR